MAMSTIVLPEGQLVGARHDRNGPCVDEVPRFDSTILERARLKTFFTKPDTPQPEHLSKARL